MVVQPGSCCTWSKNLEDRFCHEVANNSGIYVTIFSKFSDTLKSAVITLKFEYRQFCLRILLSNDADQVANRIDEEQSDLCLQCLRRPICAKFETR